GCRLAWAGGGSGLDGGERYERRPKRGVERAVALVGAAVDGSIGARPGNERAPDLGGAGLLDGAEPARAYAGQDRRPERRALRRRDGRDVGLEDARQDRPPQLAVG